MATLAYQSSGATLSSALQANSELFKKQASVYNPPDFVIHYPVKVNRHADKVSKETYEWLHEHGIDTIYPPKAYRKLIVSDFPALASRVYVDAGPNGLDWASKFITWLFALDDKMDETELGMTEAAAMPLFVELNLILLWSFPEDPVLQDRVIQFLDAISSPELQQKNREFIKDKLREAKDCPTPRVYGGKQLSPFASSLQSIWETSMLTMPEEYNLRMARSIQDYLVGNLEEARNRQHQSIPSVEEYIEIRRKTGAVLPCIIMVDIVDDVHIPSELYDSEPMERLLLAIIDIVCWHNDIFSVRKEMLLGDLHNLVFVVRHEQKLPSYDRAAFIARQMVYDRICDMEKAAADLLAITPTAHEHVVNAYIKACRHWVSGAPVWDELSGRYF